MGYFNDTYGTSQPSPTPATAPAAKVVQPTVQTAAPKPNIYNRGILGFINRVGQKLRPAQDATAGMVSDVTKVFGRAGLTISKTNESIANILAYGVAVGKGDRALAQRILQDNPAAADKLGNLINKDKYKAINLPVVGKVAPFEPPKTIKGMGQYLGAGAEIGSWLAPMGAAALNSSLKIVPTGVKVVQVGRMANAVARAKKGFMTGVKAVGPLFAAHSGGAEAQKEDATVQKVALQTSIGYVTGVGMSTVGGFVAGMLAKQPRGVKEGIVAFERAMKTPAGPQADQETIAQMRAGLAYSPNGQQLSPELVQSIVKDSTAQLDGVSLKHIVPKLSERNALRTALEGVSKGQYKNLAELAAAIDKAAAGTSLEARNLLVRQGFGSLPTMLTDPSMGKESAGRMFVKAVPKAPAATTAAVPEETFTLYRSDRTAGGNALGQGAYGSPDRAVAEEYARQQGGKVTKFTVSKATKVLEITSDEQYQKVMQAGQKIAKEKGMPNVLDGEAIKLYAESKGYQAVNATKVQPEMGMVVYKNVKTPSPAQQSAGQAATRQAGMPSDQAGQAASDLSSSTSKGTSYTPSVAQNQETVKGAKEVLQGGAAKERGFVITLKESENTPEALKQVVKGTYVPKKTSELKQVARDLIRTDVKAAEQIALNPANDVDVQIGNELLAHYAATGQTTKAKVLAQGMAESGTEFGRAVQAFANYNKTTPEGALRFAQAKVLEYNKLNPKKALALTENQIEGIFNRAKVVEKMAEGRARNIATQDLLEEINNLIPSSLGDKAITVWKAALLTSFRTHERNILGNAIHGAAETVKDIPASVTDYVLSKATGKRALTFTLKTGAYKQKGLSAAKDILYKGFDPEKTIEKFDVRHVTWDKTPVQQGLKKFTDVVFRTLGAEDKVPYNLAFGRSLYDQAGAAAINAGQKGNKLFVEKLVQKPTEEMLRLATEDAQRAVFQNPTLLRGLIGNAKNYLSKNEYAKFVGDFLMPFTGVPSSIAGEIVAYSPVGLMRGAINSAKTLLSPKNVDVATQRAIAQQVGRGVIGTGILGAGAYLAKRGLMTGEPKDATEARQWELEGKQANSILIKGKWRQINSIGPEAIVLLAGAEFGRQQKTKENPFSDKVLSTSAYLAKAFTNQTFLAGIQKPLATVMDPQKNKPTRLAADMIASWIPNLIKDAARSLDKSERETNTLFDQTVASIPWARNTLLPKRDALGAVIPNQQAGARAFVDLFRSKASSTNPLVLEFSRLYNNGVPITPSKWEQTQQLFGAKIKVDPKLLDTLEKESGGQITTLLTALMNTEKYKSADDDTKQQYIKVVIDTVKKIVKQKYLLPVLKRKTSMDEEVQKLLQP